MSETKKTLQELALGALLVQDACNLCGVAQGFARAMIDLGAYTNGTDERNTHPISIVWADKIASLTGSQTINLSSAVERAYVAVRDLARGKNG